MTAQDLADEANRAQIAAVKELLSAVDELLAEVDYKDYATTRIITRSAIGDLRRAAEAVRREL